MRNLMCERLEADEVWSFVGAKEANVKDGHPEGYGDCYTFTVVDPITKLMPCWLVGTRSRQCAFDFMADLASRVVNVPQLTTDGFMPYPNAVDAAFKGRVHYAVLNKTYGNVLAAKDAARRHSPAMMTKCEKIRECGNHDTKFISTSIVEPTNLSLRMSNRRFARLTNAFSRKMENHMRAISFYFMTHNFV